MDLSIMNTNELLNLQGNIVKQLKVNLKVAKLKTKLEIGDLVTIDHPKCKGLFTISKFEEDKCCCVGTTGWKIRVPYEIIYK